jgi:hypothetical protein
MYGTVVNKAKLSWISSSMPSLVPKKIWLSISAPWTKEPNLSGHGPTLTEDQHVSKGLASLTGTPWLGEVIKKSYFVRFFHKQIISCLINFAKIVACHCVAGCSCRTSELMNSDVPLLSAECPRDAAAFNATRCVILPVDGLSLSDFDA